MSLLSMDLYVRARRREFKDAFTPAVIFDSCMAEEARWVLEGAVLSVASIICQTEGLDEAELRGGGRLALYYGYP